MVVKEPVIKVAAIDNGLAFPLKHPDSWRACKSQDHCGLALFLLFLSVPICAMKRIIPLSQDCSKD